jgi:hypothetical protein
MAASTYRQEDSQLSLFVVFKENAFELSKKINTKNVISAMNLATSDFRK